MTELSTARRAARLFTEIEIMWQGVNSVISKDENGLYNLTEVHKAGKFKDSKRPSQWERSNKAFISRQNSKCANLHIKAFEVKEGKFGGTWGNERILQKYLQWLSPDYEDVVLDAIGEIANGNARNSYQDCDDPVMASLYASLDNRKKIFENEARLAALEEKVESKTKKRKLIKEEPPCGYENKGTVAKYVADTTKTSIAIVNAVLERYSTKILKKNYLVECYDGDVIVQTYPTCYYIFDVVECVKDAVRHSEKQTEHFRIFKTLGNKKMKLSRGK